MKKALRKLSSRALALTVVVARCLRPRSPQTGDNSNLPLWALCSVAALTGLALCGMALRKRLGSKAG